MPDSAVALIAVSGFLLVLFLLGWILAGLLDRDLGGLERIGLGYPIGAAAFTWVIFLVSCLGVPVTLAAGAVVCLILIGAGLVLLWRNGTLRFPRSIRLVGLDGTQLALVGAIGVVVAAAFALGTYWPPFEWDALVMWVLKGKLIAGSGLVPTQAQAANISYPLNIPLQISYLYLLGGAFLQIIFPVYFVSLIVLFYANLRRSTGSILALTCSLLLAATPTVLYHATVAFADLPFAAYYVGSAIYLYRYLNEKKSSWLVISGVLLGCAAWTRIETPLYLAINLFVLLMFSKLSRATLKSALAYVGLFIVFWLPWFIFSKIQGYYDPTGSGIAGVVDLAHGNLNLPLLAQILTNLKDSALDINDWGAIWTALAIAVVIGLPYLRRHGSMLLLIGANLAGLLFTFYAGSVNNPQMLGWWLYTAFDRLALHWAPLTIFYFGLTLGSTGLMNRNNFPFRLSIDPYLVLLVLFSLFAIGPLLAPGYFWGAHDGRHSVYFLFEFDRVIQDGVFYPRWLPDFTFGYGYPFFNIYGPGAFYVGEALHLIGFDFVTATKIVFGAAMILSGVTMFGFVKRLTGSSAAAFLSGLLYVYIPYHIADLYVRAALEESIFLVFLPLVFWGFHETVTRPSRVFVIATAMAYGAMMFAHNGLTLIATPVLAIWVLFLMVGEIRKKGIAVRTKTFVVEFIRTGLPSLGAILLGLCLVAIFFVPAILEYSYVRTDQWIGNYYDYANHFVYLFQLFSPFWGFGISVPGPHDGMSFQLGVIPVLFAVLSILTIVKNRNGLRRFWLFFLVSTIVIAFLSLGPAAPIWKALPFLAFVQFPWRLEALTSLGLAVLAGAAVLGEGKARAATLTLPTILLGLLVVLGSFPYLTAQITQQAPEGPVSILGLFRFQQSAGEMTGSTSTVKDIPTWSPMADVYFANMKVKTKIAMTEIDSDKLWIGVLPNFMGLHTDGERIAFSAKEDNLPITFNIFDYPGWSAYLVKPWSTDIIRQLPIEPVGDLGRIQVKVPKGNDQWLMLHFDDTPPRTAGKWISALSILGCLGVLVWDVRTKRRQKVEPAGNAPDLSNATPQAQG